MTEQTDRDRIVAALYDSRRYGLGGMSEAQAVGHMADAVLAALVPAVPAGQAPATDQTAPVDWIDGHPQLEAIAAAVWEHCRTEDTSLVVDDPRNIAVAALAAVLPASVNRATVLQEAADELDAYIARYRSPSIANWTGAVAFLRHLAAETPSAVVVRRATDETPGEAQLPFIHVDDDGDQLDIGAVMASTYDGEAPVVYVAAEQHQGDTLATVYVRPERVDAVIAALRSARLAAETLPAADQQQPKEA